MLPIVAIQVENLALLRFAAVVCGSLRFTAVLWFSEVFVVSCCSQDGGVDSLGKASAEALRKSPDKAFESAAGRALNKALNKASGELDAGGKPSTWLPPG